MKRYEFENGMDIKDLRGCHTNRPHAVPGNLKELFREHISPFPKQESHYSRAKTHTKFLSEDLNLNKMYKLFGEKYPRHKNISIRTYKDIFAELNLKFGLHLIPIHAHFAINIILNINIFYQRQLSNYNLDIHDAASNNAFMLLWNETVATRGATEISSCLLRYVKEHFQPLQTNERKHLIIWSDRCIGQNNNWGIITTLKLLVDMKYFTEVHQKFVSTGHSFLPCDRDVSLIE